MATNMAMPTTFAASAAFSAPRAAAEPEARDRRRPWLWGFLAVVAASQLYFVRELVAAFALFAIAFVATAAVVAVLYMLLQGWALVIARLAALRRPVMDIAQATTLASTVHQNQKAA